MMKDRVLNEDMVLLTTKVVLAQGRLEASISDTCEIVISAT